MAGIEAAGLQGRSGRLSARACLSCPKSRRCAPGLEPVLRGRRFVRVEQRRKDLRFPLPDRFAERLTGRKVLSARPARQVPARATRQRRGAGHAPRHDRALHVSAPGGANGKVLGDYTYEHGEDAKHDHVVFTMSGGAVVTYNDARRFGYMTLIAGSRPRAATPSSRASASSRSAMSSTARLSGRRGARPQGSTSRRS